MADKIAEAYVEVSANTEKMSGDLKKGKTALVSDLNDVARSASPAAGRLMDVVGSVGAIHPAAMAAAGGIAGVTAAFAALQQIVQATIAAVRSTAQEMDRVAKLADRIDVTTESLVALERGAALSGVSAGKLQDALQTMNKNLGEASQGTGTAKDALKELGLSIDTLMTLKADKQFAVLADAINKVESPAKRTALAMDVFGRSGKGELLNFLVLGSEGFRKLSDEADAMGLTFSRETAAQAEILNDTLDDLGRRGTALKVILAEELLPAFNEILTALMNNEEIWNTAADGMQAFASTARVAAEVVAQMIRDFETLEDSNAFWILQQLSKTTTAGQSVDAAGNAGSMALQPFSDLNEQVRRERELDKQFRELEDKRLKEKTEAETEVIKQLTEVEIAEAEQASKERQVIDQQRMKEHLALLEDAAAKELQLRKPLEEGASQKELELRKQMDALNDTLSAKRIRDSMQEMEGLKRQANELRAQIEGSPEGADRDKLRDSLKKNIQQQEEKRQQLDEKLLGLRKDLLADEMDVEREKRQTAQKEAESFAKEAESLLEMGASRVKDAEQRIAEMSKVASGFIGFEDLGRDIQNKLFEQAELKRQLELQQRQLAAMETQVDEAKGSRKELEKIRQQFEKLAVAT